MITCITVRRLAKGERKKLLWLVEMAYKFLGHTMPIYPGHNPKDGFDVEASHLVFVLEAGGVERGLRQLSHMEFSLISDVATIPNNGKIGGIAKPGDLIFFEFDLSNTVLDI
jgi:hypothetical protein